MGLCESETSGLPAVLLILGVELVCLLGLLGHPAGHQLLVVVSGFPQLLLQSAEGDLQGVILVLQGLVRPLQVLQGQEVMDDLVSVQSHVPLQAPVCVSPHQKN